jgi:arsenite methyltransferase
MVTRVRSGEPERSSEKSEEVVRDEVKEYYGKILAKTEDLKTNACCTAEAPPPHVRDALAKVHPDVLAKYYGCGLVAPELLEGLRVLDLGCGSGRDVYVLASLVGEKGFVAGVDMTQEQLSVARAATDHHAKAHGWAEPNVAFHHGFIERLGEIGLADGSFDVVVSNCVVNLSPDKRAVLAEAYRVLRPGGELYFSDVYASRRVPTELRTDATLHGECLAGALYWNDFVHLAKECGFGDPRLVKDAPIELGDRAIEEKIGHIDFYSATYRLFKLDGLEPDCEDYGQAVVYRGTVPRCARAFELDGHHRIETGKVFPVCGNTWRMLAETRFAPHFDFIGNFDTHYGIFDGCGKSLPFTTADKAPGACC